MIERVLGIAFLVTVIVRESWGVEFDNLVFISGSILAFTYLFANWWISKPKESNVRTIALTLLYGLASFSLTISLIFQLLFYAGAHLQSILSIILLVIALGIDFISSRNRDKVIKKSTMWRVGILLCLVVVFYIVPQDNRIFFTYRDQPEFLEYYKTSNGEMDFVDLKEEYFGNHKDKNINITIVDEGDTLSRFLYSQHEKFDFHKKYDFYFAGKKDTAIMKRHLLKYIPGEFGFGLMDNVTKVNRYLIFKSATESSVTLSEQPEVPFLTEEFDLGPQSEVHLVVNFIDSTESPPVKYQVYLATDKVSKDTITIQEVQYWIHNNHLAVSILVYDSKTARDEMVALINNAIETMGKSLQ